MPPTIYSATDDLSTLHQIHSCADGGGADSDEKTHKIMLSLIPARSLSYFEALLQSSDHCFGFSAPCRVVSGYEPGNTQSRRQ